MSAPALVTSSQTTWDGLATSRAGTEPTGTVQGNLLVGLVNTGQDGDRTITGPAGWTESGSAVITNDGGAWRVNNAAFWIERGSSAPSLTWTFSVSCFSQISIFRVTGHKRGFPIGFNTGNSGTGNTSTFTGGTASASSLLIFSHHDMEDPPRSPPSGVTEVDDSVLWTGYEALGAAGATGNLTMTNNTITGSEQWSTRVVEVLAAPPVPSLYINQAVKRAAYW